MTRRKSLKAASEAEGVGSGDAGHVVRRHAMATVPIAFGVEQYAEGMGKVQGIRGEIESLEIDRARALKNYKEKIEEREAQRDALLDELGKGCTYREVDCEDVWDFVGRTVTRYRLDVEPPVEILRREMTNRELQMEIAGCEASELLDKLVSALACPECGVAESAPEFKGWSDDTRTLCAPCAARVSAPVGGVNAEWRSRPEHAGICQRCECDGSLPKFEGWGNKKKTLCMRCLHDLEREAREGATSNAPRVCPKCGKPTDGASWSVRREDSDPWMCVGCAERAALEAEEAESGWTQRNNMDARKVEYLDASGTVMRSRAMTLFEQRQAAKGLPAAERKAWLEGGSGDGN